MVEVTSSLFRANSRSWFNPWVLANFLLVCIFLGPIIAIFVTASGDSEGLWAHLFETVLPRYVMNTVVLASGVALVSLVFGVTSAWVVVRYDFPGRRIFEWMLLLPAAVPAYLIAYTYTDFLEYAGPVQRTLRGLFGWQSAADYWFPEIRSMGGAMLVMGAVLYPYVYAMSRAAFLLTPASLFEAGMLARRNLFWSIALPLARPAIVAGLALVLMETVSDFGTVEYFAIETLTLGIFNVWLGMNSLTAASQIAAFAVIFIIALVVLEKIARSRRRFTDTTRRSATLRRQFVKGRAVALYWGVCIAPIFTGFLVPVGVLLSFVLRGHSLGFNDSILAATFNSVFLAAAVTLLVIAAAAFMGVVAAYKGAAALRRLTALASIGYAFPGTILAIGVVTAGGALDGVIAAFMKGAFEVSYQGWLTSGVGLIILGCVVRFQAVGYGAVTSGLERLPPNMMEASRVLGWGFGYSMWRVILPLMRLSFIAGGLLVFVDVMKELPMTLLLRPFNFESLATYVYQFAKDELLEEAALPALIIISTGIIPVLMMNAALGRFTRY